MQLLLSGNVSSITKPSTINCRKLEKSEENHLAHPYQLHHNYSVFSPKHFSTYCPTSH